MVKKMDQIAVDPDFYSMATGYDMDHHDLQSDTTSIASAIARGRLENGRRYQAIKEDDYCDVADRYPLATVRGVDLFPPPVLWMPPNCIFEVDDVLREWTWREPFDFIHMRLMYGAFPPDGWQKLYKQAYDALEPGGWIEQIELDVRVYSDDGTLTKEHQLYGWGDIFIGCSERAGRSLRTHETMRSAIEEAGFVDVHEEKYKIPLGCWARDNILKEAGHLQHSHWNAALEGWAMWLLTHFGEPEPWSKEEVQVFLVKVRKELNNPRIHAYEPANRVWARKPLKEELKVEEVKIKAEKSA